MNKLGSLFRALVALVLASATACAPGGADPDALGEEESALYDPLIPPVPVATDDCNDPDHAGETWTSSSAAHFVANYLPGTAAETDIADILARREAAYAAIRTALGVTDEPILTVDLSPSRVAAQAHGKLFSKSWPGEDRYQVVYPGGAGSAEVDRVGYHIARLLEAHMDSLNPRHLTFLSNGLADYLDQSGRDLQAAYAEQMIAGLESRVALEAFDDDDVSGSNRGRAGSFVKFLIDRYGMTTFNDILKAAAVGRGGGCNQLSATYGCVDSAESLAAALDGILTATTGESLAAIQPDWRAAVQTALDTIPTGVARSDRDEIANLLGLMDEAIATDDAAMYRSAMDGFYCERGEARRTDIAARAVQAFTGSQIRGIRIYPAGVRAYPSARIVARRLEDRNVVSNFTAMAEKFPEGWRITSGPDWR